MKFELSAAGETRKREMLRELNATMARRRASRVLRKAGAAAFVLAAPVLVWMNLPGGSLPAVPGGGSGVFAVAETTLTVVIATDESVVDRLGTRTELTMVHMISDGELRTMLDESGVTEGFVRLGGRVILASDIPGPDERPANETDPAS